MNSLENLLNDQRACTFDMVAKTMLVFMIRGLCTGLQYPYAQFACKNTKADQMYLPVTEAIFQLERLGLKVKGNLCCDCTYFSANFKRYNNY